MVRVMEKLPSLVEFFAYYFGDIVVVYPYASIFHVKRKGKYKITILLRFRSKIAVIWF